MTSRVILLCAATWILAGCVGWLISSTTGMVWGLFAASALIGIANFHE